MQSECPLTQLLELLVGLRIIWVFVGVALQAAQREQRAAQ